MHSNTSVVPLLHSVIVPSVLHTPPAAVHGGKHEDHHEGGFGADRSAQVRLSSICWHDDDSTSALKAPWHSATVVPHDDTFEQNWEANEPPPPLLLLHAAASTATTTPVWIDFILPPGAIS